MAALTVAVMAANLDERTVDPLVSLKVELMVGYLAAKLAGLLVGLSVLL